MKKYQNVFVSKSNFAWQFIWYNRRLYEIGFSPTNVFTISWSYLKGLYEIRLIVRRFLCQFTIIHLNFYTSFEKKNLQFNKTKQQSMLREEIVGIIFHA